MKFSLPLILFVCGGSLFARLSPDLQLLPGKLVDLGVPAQVINAIQADPESARLMEEAAPKLLAILKAYPLKFSRMSYDVKRHDLYLLTSTGIRYYWATGRLLRVVHLKQVNEYRPHFSYRYTPDVPNPAEWSEEDRDKVRRDGDKSTQMERPPYANDFFIGLYGGITERELTAKLVRTNFLGKSFRTHTMLVAPLNRVQKKILAGKQRPDIKAFLDNLESVSSYAARSIRGSRSLSYHNFGVAVDVLPIDRHGPIYWAWERDRDVDWLTDPGTHWAPPQAVISAFESEGFVWGGKWVFYDNMHFEYRPELKILYELNRQLGIPEPNYP